MFQTSSSSPTIGGLHKKSSEYYKMPRGDQHAQQQDHVTPAFFRTQHETPTIAAESQQLECSLRFRRIFLLLGERLGLIILTFSPYYTLFYRPFWLGPAEEAAFRGHKLLKRLGCPTFYANSMEYSVECHEGRWRSTENSMACHEPP